MRRLLSTGWRRRRLSGEDPGWALWTRPKGDSRDVGETHKLYISPMLDDVRPVFQAVMPSVTESEAIGFKVGAELPDLLRPDKLVVYFASRAELFRVAGVLAPRLAAFEPHGVPFTCPFGDGGMLSWGIDPPGRTDQSWRSWLVLKLAHAMTDTEPDRGLQAALERARALGLDPVSWEPTGVDWERDGPD